MPIKLKNVKDQDELDAAVKKEVADAVKKETKELKEKNNELLGKISDGKKDKKKLEELEEKIEGLEEEKEKLEKTIKDEGGNEYKSLYEGEKTKVEKLEGQIEDLKTEHKETLDGQSIRSAATKKLSDLKADPETLDTALDLVTKGAKVVGEDGTLLVGNKTLDDHIEEWSETATGKRFLLAGDNRGGGADNDNKGGDSGDWDKHFHPKTANLTKQAELAGKDPKKYEEMTNKYYEEDGSPKPEYTEE